MRNPRSSRRLLVVQTLILATALCGRAFAQAAGPPASQNATDTGSNGDQLQEVVVTAQFRNENAQQTPLARRTYRRWPRASPV
jgi:outer membrane receptor protein involved in Fe transport